MSVFPGKGGAGHPRSRVLSLPGLFGRKSRRNDAQRAETAPQRLEPDPCPDHIEWGLSRLDCHPCGVIRHAHYEALAADPFRCICDPDDIFDPPDPTPRAVEGCPAHRGRYVAQNWVP
jgi:hypothetical protein